MSKVISFLVSILFFSTLCVQQVAAIGAYTGPSCASQGILITVDTPANRLTDQAKAIIGIQQRIGVNVKIPDSVVQNTWEYYIIFLTHPDLTSEHITTFNNRILGSNPTRPETINGVLYRVYHWDLPTGLGKSSITGNVDNEYAIGLKHFEQSGAPTLPLINSSLGRGADICIGPEKQVTTTDTFLLYAGSCPLTMSDNYNSGTPITGTTVLNNVPSVAYGYRIDPGDHSTTINQKFRNPLKPVRITEIPGYNDLRFGDLQNQSIPLTPNPITGGSVNLPSQTRDNGTYTATIYVQQDCPTCGLKYVYACGSRVIKVGNAPTTPPTASGGTNSLASLAGGFNPNNAVLNGVIINAGKLAPASGKGCNNDNGVETAIGCVPTEPVALIKGVLTFSTRIAGGLTLLLMIFGAFEMITSAGNPDTLKKGQERFRDAIIGLLFIIFSVLLLQIIGVDILGIPGFKAP